jgi:hypothetical protein
MFPEQGDHQSARSLHYIKYQKKTMFKTKQSIQTSEKRKRNIRTQSPNEYDWTPH